MCGERGKSFWRNSPLNKHWRIHTWQAQYKCSKCGKILSQKSVFIYSQWGLKGNSFVCCECAKSFSHSSECIEPWRVPTGQRPYRCSECGKYFASSFDLFIVKGLTQEKDLVSAVNVGNPLRVILNWLNTRERPYECSKREKFFKQMSYHSRH